MNAVCVAQFQVLGLSPSGNVQIFFTFKKIFFIFR